MASLLLQLAALTSLVVIITTTKSANGASLSMERVSEDCSNLIYQYEDDHSRILDDEFQQKVTECRRLLALELLESMSSSSSSIGGGNGIFGRDRDDTRYFMSYDDARRFDWSEDRPKCYMKLYNKPHKQGRSIYTGFRKTGNIPRGFRVKSIQTFGPCSWRIFSPLVNGKRRYRGSAKIPGNSEFMDSGDFGLRAVGSYKKLKAPRLVP